MTRRVGHKGADALVPGNTPASFRAAAEIGVDMVELDVLWTPEGHPELPSSQRAPLVVAHDWEEARRDDEVGAKLELEGALSAFGEPPLADVEIDCDLKLRGREDELHAQLRDAGLLDRSMVSTMEVESLAELERLDSGLRRGWTYPRVSRDWSSKRWARPAVAATLLAMRRRLPGLAERRLPQLGVQAMWVYYPLVTERLAEVADQAGVELIAWTVDDAGTMRRLVEHGVHGLCSNDPRLFRSLPEVAVPAVDSSPGPG